MSSLTRLNKKLEILSKKWRRNQKGQEKARKLKKKAKKTVMMT
jgi:hypothetical protein